MKSLPTGLFACGVAMCAWFLLRGAPATDQQVDLLWHHRNLGKAFYENPTTQKEAVDEFKKALEMQPNSVRERINYGLALIKAGDTLGGVAELEKAQKQDPSVPHTWFNLGIIAKKDGDSVRGIQQLQGMEKLVPGDSKTHYNLGVLYKPTDRDKALRELEMAEHLDPNFAAPHLQLFNLYRTLSRTDDSKREIELFQKIKAQQVGAPVAEDAEANNYSEIYDPIDVPASAAEPVKTQYTDKIVAEKVTGFAPLDRDHVIAWSPAGVLLEPGRKQVLDAKDVISIAPGDFDNDGLFDLCVIRQSGVELYHNAGGKYTKVELKVPAGKYERALWLDYDHDNDMDLVLLGEQSGLLRNNGSAGFSDETKSFPFLNAHAIDVTRFALLPETAARDMVVSYADHAGILYRDKLNGIFEAIPIPALPAGTRGLEAQDFNHDSLLDITAASLVLKNDGSGLTATAVPNDLDKPLFILEKGGDVHRVEAVKGSERWLTIEIKGIKNVKLGIGSTIEIKAGATYQKKVYEGIPLWYGMKNYPEADTVRITWINGLIQNEPQKKTNDALSIEEAQRLSGSCPMIFTWNGQGFDFITDVLGVAPLGASSGDGQYFPVDHDEYIQIPGEKLQAKNGEFEVRITEELREVSYLDKVQLIAVDHPESEEIFTNDKFKSPPFPEFHLFGVQNRIYPVAARNDKGGDVRPALLHKDRLYADGFKRNYLGVAEQHTIDLNFAGAAPDNNAVLVLNGWVDWADGSTFLGASQEGKGGLVLPYLQVKDAHGQWMTVIDDMGIPAGKPKTISVDMTGKFLSASREIRIVTNICVYWDEIFLAEHAGTPNVKLTNVDADTANLHYRGFSRPVIDRERKQPEDFRYSSWMPLSMWNPTAGMYTRYGDVHELVTDVDDELTIMGSGDELTLHFPTSKLPALPGNWRRDYLLLVDGWAKDADANTAFSQTVEPLPFHAMSAYPYRSDEHFPDDAVHREYRKNYLTRPALRLIRPLT